MEMRDQVSHDHEVAQRAWRSFSEPEQAALLIDLSGSLRRRLMYLEVEQPLAKSYRALAHAARHTGQALVRKNRIGYLPEVPFRWSQFPLSEVNRRVPEIEAWASETVMAQRELLYVRHSAVDLREASRDLEHHLARPRQR